MYKKVLLTTVAMVISSITFAVANPFSDVPIGHWSYNYINNLANKGILKGYPNYVYKGDEKVSRYHLAVVTARILANYEQNKASMTKEDFQKLKELTLEFGDELILLGYKTIDLNDKFKGIKEDVSNLKKDVNQIKTSLNNGGLKKVKLSGDTVIRNYGFKHDRGANLGEDHRHRTESIFRLQLDASIDENVLARARWIITGYNGGSEWNGNNKQTSDVEVAYLDIKDLFGSGGNFKFGRDWYGHGHKFVIYNYMDAVGYTKKCGDVDLAFNLFFMRNNDPVSGRDTYNVWNINADYSTNGHNLYLGFYHNKAVRSDGNFPPNALPSNEKATRIEFGSYGKIRNNDKLSYDLAFVHSDLKEADEKGMLSHIALNYDSKKQFSAKLAYTHADDKSNANINVENQNSFLMCDETIFEDLYFASMAANNKNTNLTYKNLTDVKVQVGYTPSNNKKHNVRLAYDFIENNKDNKPNTFSTRTGVPAFTTDLEGNVITMVYSYNIAEHTRLRICYQNSKIKSKDMPDQKVDLYFTEIYSRF